MGQTLLVLRPLGLGDFLTGVPAYRGLARTFAGHRRVLAAPRALHVLLHLIPDVFHGAVDVEPLAPLPRSLARVDVAVDLHGRGPESHRVLLALEPHRLIAFRNDAVPESAGGAPWTPDEHEVARWCRMLDHAGVACEPGALDLAVPATTVPPRMRGAVVVHPGAASGARRWPPERWARVVRAMRERGRAVILTGTRAERDAAVEVAAHAGLPSTHNLAGRTSLLELAALVAHASCVASADTGVAHLATAYRTPSVVLFGPTPPAEWGPPARAYHRVLWTGGRGDPHASAVDDRLLAIHSDEVVAALDALGRHEQTARKRGPGRRRASRPPNATKWVFLKP